ncbi:MAG: galactokinase family protein, partial [Dethiobacteria bacterium]
MKVKATAPGRINLIGEHTDYNEGFVMPAAIDYAVTVEAAPRKDRHITAVSEGFGGSETFSLDQLERDAGEIRWVDYITGVCRAFEKAGYQLSGAYLSISSRVPVGAGLSSSAALEVAVAA